MSKVFRKSVSASLWAIACCYVLISCSKLNEYSASGGSKTPPEGEWTGDVLYIQTNNYGQGQNAVLAYRVDGAGRTAVVEGSPFLTGGTGLPNTQNPGSFDSDHEVMITSDKRFLLTVNSGDNTVAVFAIQSNGTLQLVPGAPFASGGETPVSIDQWQQYIFVLNKSNHPAQPSTSAPNYSVFKLESNGQLTLVSKFEVRDGVSPAQVLVARNGAFVYGSNSWGFSYTPPAVPMNLFAISSDGKLIAGPDAPATHPQNSGALGMCQSWKQNVLYVAFPFSSQFSYYNINTSTGELTHAGDITVRKGCSRFCTNNSNDRLFAINTMDNSITLFDITDAHSPRKTADLMLKQCGAAYAGFMGQYTSSQCVSVAASTNNQLAYVVSQHTNPDLTIGNYNYLHVLQVGTEGALQEKEEPVQLAVDNKYRPRGLAVLRAS